MIYSHSKVIERNWGWEFMEDLETGSGKEEQGHVPYLWTQCYIRYEKKTATTKEGYTAVS